MRIATNKFVSVEYDLNVGEEGDVELMEQATEERPLEFIFGTGSMLPSFEAKLKGLSAGEGFEFSLTPEEAYGEYDEANVVELPKNIFERDGRFDDEMVVEGHTVPMMDSDGNRMLGSVLAVGDETVTMDFNHPLSGETLHFTGKVLAVREATADDVMRLTKSCGCSCDDCGDEEDCSCGCDCCK
ncbi:MAG: peptidylprolyl isomerase [Tannerella sp.]|jgi:FKBP-type peptidyl-prolyl cis-trans isomerase SlyD|nr:peptidylprolyl isomerase [Tannerella sp.]